MRWWGFYTVLTSAESILTLKNCELSSYWLDVVKKNPFLLWRVDSRTESFTAYHKLCIDEFENQLGINLTDDDGGDATAAAPSRHARRRNQTEVTPPSQPLVASGEICGACPLLAAAAALLRRARVHVGSLHARFVIARARPHPFSLGFRGCC